jgi:hypothetical protein
MDWRGKLKDDYTRFTEGLPKPFESYILDAYQIDLRSEYGGLSIRNPFGKASGQLSLNSGQIERDREAGLGFVVLKTVIAEDETGEQSMRAWAIPAARMTVESITGTRPNVRGQQGWTVTWRGRGWSESFAKYLELFDRSLQENTPGFVVAPSVKYHLPKPGEHLWRSSEYEFTTSRLFEVWRRHRRTKMPLEKDFSPTLAGDHNFTDVRQAILNWLTEVPRLIRQTSNGNDISIGLKLFNAMHSDDFQIELLDLVFRERAANFITYGNRLFDPTKTYETVTGVAFGGPDLSDRNLWALDRVNPSIPLCATGNITTGQMAFEYLLRGATSLQMHTVFQLPDSEFDMKGGTRTERALHRLIFHPEHGIIRAIREHAERRGLLGALTIQSLAGGTD